MQADRPPLILVVEDEATLRESCVSVLTHDGYDVVSSARGDEARELLQRRAFDIVLLDLHMPQVTGLELMRICLEHRPQTLVIVMTGNASLESSMDAMKAGAWDYLPKPFTATHLQILLGRAWHAIQVARQNGAALREDEDDSSGSTGAVHEHSEHVALLGRSPSFLRAIRLAEKVALTDASVFLTGESGSGKEVIAQFIHHHSRRSRRTMVAVNCAALPETLLESEMFGHVKGAFTGAVRDKPGLLETAHGGTFFLDELTEMSPTIQAKLLRVIQDGQVRRVGAEMVDATVDVRFIAATNRSPKQAVEEGILRKDLFYRLSVVPIRIPPLRERKEDIALLAEHFLGVYWKKHREKRAALPTLTETAIRSLQARVWSGNVRELQNVMEHAVVLLEPGSQVQPDDLPYLDDDLSTAYTPATPDGIGIQVPAEAEYHEAREQVIAEFELSYFNKLVDRANSNMSEAARLAGVDRTTLYRLMEKHGLQRNTVIKAG